MLGDVLVSVSVMEICIGCHFYWISFILEDNYIGSQLYRMSSILDVIYIGRHLYWMSLYSHSGWCLVRYLMFR